MVDKPDCKSDNAELHPSLIRLQGVLSDKFGDAGFSVVMTDNIPSVEITKEMVHDLCVFFKEDPFYDSKMLSCMAGVDYVDYCQILYMLYSVENNCTVGIKCNIDYESPMPSVSDLWKAADWYEREIHDLYGIEFEGNEDMSPLLLYDGFEGYPGKKDFPFYDYQEY
tara:strand:+ start:9455 stop:9955 length:501 start_codon:yes stop_codon:yes gene_type:complete